MRQIGLEGDRAEDIKSVTIIGGAATSRSAHRSNVVQSRSIG